MKKRLFAAALAFICIFLLLPALFADTVKVKNGIRIGILPDCESLNIASDKNYSVKNTGKSLKLSPGNINIRLAGNKIIIGKYNLDLPVKISGDSYIAVNKKFYRGSVIIRLSKNKKLNIINVLNIEDYLKGVLPKEVNPQWNIEALKAQAVISRSYAIKNLNRHSCDGFDLCSSVHCQVYGGAGVENQKCNEAVEATKEEVLFFKGEIAQTVFHASCGGHTEDPKYVWNWNTETPAYLKGVKDKYCSGSPHNKWSCSISEAAIINKLNRAGYKIGKIKSIKMSGKTSGHAKEFLIIKHKKGKLKINAYKFRLTVEPNIIKSAMIKSIDKKGNCFVFAGKGWGHRVGLCQCGAKTMAEKGFSYKKILKHYYPKTKIKCIRYE